MVATGRFAAHAGRRSSRLSLRRAATIAFWSLAWIALWHVASFLAVAYGISVWYPPAAISLLMTIRYGWSGAVGVFCATLLVSLDRFSASPGLHHVAASLAHVAAYAAAALFYRAAVERGRRSLRPRAVVALMGAALLGATLASALGNLNHHLESGGTHALNFRNLLGWTVGDFFGAMSICPFLLFLGTRLRASRGLWKGLARHVKASAAAFAIAVALAALFAMLSREEDVSFRLVTVVGVGVYSVVVASVLSPTSTLIYLFAVSTLSAAWLSTELAPAARLEFAVQIVTFLIASYATVALSMDRMRLRAAAAVRRVRIADLAGQRDALNRRIKTIEDEFAQLAHELKTPLGGIIGLLEIVEVGAAAERRGDAPAGAGQAQAARYFKHMRGCALYLNTLVDDAFDVARASRAGLEPTIAEFDVLDTLEDLALISQARGPSEMVIPDDLRASGAPVRSDRNRLLQILVNLLVNAMRYSDPRNSVKVACSVTREHVVISVANASSAVTADQLDRRIRGETGPAGGSQGLGIGLPLVGRLSASIGAKVSTAVAEGVVTISVSLPRA
ncbi:ATP-binding protein [Rubrimonas cliftonensis]|uniref:histidine kinase n=1 Tax=Rubrimonas cliftonensis TaxID=89524 RepID=A0A1H3XJV1_9RHOB|nr:ATP-binding protein [Rubrimonas cliftonensis]SDZ99619.1 Signal transduction histidine kinase [Rubrimonas cliftonensis]